MMGSSQQLRELFTKVHWVAVLFASLSIWGRFIEECSLCMCKCHWVHYLLCITSLRNWGRFTLNPYSVKSLWNIVLFDIVDVWLFGLMFVVLSVIIFYLILKWSVILISILWYLKNDPCCPSAPPYTGISYSQMLRHVHY